MTLSEPRVPPQAVLFFGVFTRYEQLFPAVRRLIEERFGKVHPRGESPTFPFPDTRSYRESMGAGLKRKFFVVDEVWPQVGLARVKHATIAMEKAVQGEGKFDVARPVNIDPGLINDCRVILASTKDYAHRLYRGDGIWEEITLVYEKGAFRPHPWTYPDFRAPTYHAFFETFRDEVLRRIEETRAR